ncbi:MAG: QueT transporter family protein [Firmicutes bacterium]|nr:QueT transporter family protein [Bacillota bacterium]
MAKTKKLTISAMMIALYVVLMYCTQSFAFGQYQLRIATSLYAFAYFFPFLVLPMGIANMLSNMVMGGMGVFDIVGGFAAGILTTLLMVLIRRKNWSSWLVALPIAFVPSLLVPIWLSKIIGVPYPALFVSLFVGQAVAGIIGAAIVKVMKDKIPLIMGDMMQRGENTADQRTA